jgi:hypothetical protein
MKNAISGKLKVWDSFISEFDDFKLMRKDFTSDFYDLYNEGFECYIRGDWEKAVQRLNEAEVIIFNKIFYRKFLEV